MAAQPPGPGERSDEHWLAALTGNRDEAWALLRETVRRGLLAYVRERAGDREQRAGIDSLVDDATQETLLAVRAKLDTFRGDSRFTTWVYRIAVNALLGQLRLRRWRDAGPARSDVPLEWPFEDPLPRPDRAAQAREIWELVRRVLEHELTPHQRTVILAHVFDRKPLDLVAADLGISRDAAYKTIHDARRKLRAALVAHGLTLDQTREIFGG